MKPSRLSALCRSGVVYLLIACVALATALFMPPIALKRAFPDVVAVFDITQSMNVADATLNGQPVSRLKFAKSALIQTLSQMPCGSKLGLGIFTEYRTYLMFLPVEVCANRPELADNIEHLDGRMAWAGASEIAKGINSARRQLKGLEHPTALAFFTDGHEAPPINAQYRIELHSGGGVVEGTLIGVGGLTPQPIPKIDPEGHAAGVWEADEVLQTDLYAAGRQGSEAHEAMAESTPQGPVPAALRGTPGSEHLSGLHQGYLQLLAAEGKLAYRRLDTANSLTAIFTSAAMTQPRTTPTDLRWMAAVVALIALLLTFFIVRADTCAQS